MSERRKSTKRKEKHSGTTQRRVSIMFVKTGLITKKLERDITLLKIDQCGDYVSGWTKIPAGTEINLFSASNWMSVLEVVSGELVGYYDFENRIDD